MYPHQPCASTGHAGRRRGTGAGDLGAPGCGGAARERGTQGCSWVGRVPPEEAQHVVSQRAGAGCIGLPAGETRLFLAWVIVAYWEAKWMTSGAGDIYAARCARGRVRRDSAMGNGGVGDEARVIAACDGAVRGTWPVMSRGRVRRAVRHNFYVCNGGTLAIVERVTTVEFYTRWMCRRAGCTHERRAKARSVEDVDGQAGHPWVPVHVVRAATDTERGCLRWHVVGSGTKARGQDRKKEHGVSAGDVVWVVRTGTPARRIDWTTARGPCGGFRRLLELYSPFIPSASANSSWMFVAAIPRGSGAAMRRGGDTAWDKPVWRCGQHESGMRRGEDIRASTKTGSHDVHQTWIEGCVQVTVVVAFASHAGNA
ncbi:hypothetical protein C8J57DRAFT_1466656 [Mycena rebaudengoi]|nr:hypothetical protein C8J57DRAFT_1466656 [Mycena rebaudengoi]